MYRSLVGSKKNGVKTFYCKIPGISKNKEKFYTEAKTRIRKKFVKMRVNTLNIGFWVIFATYEIMATGILSDAFVGILAQFGRAEEFLEFISRIFNIVRFPMNLMGKLMTGRKIWFNSKK